MKWKGKVFRTEVCRGAFMPSPGMPPSQCLDVFTNPKSQSLAPALFLEVSGEYKYSTLWSPGLSADQSVLRLSRGPILSQPHVHKFKYDPKGAHIMSNKIYH